MQDGLRTENFLVGSVTSNTLSGDIINVGEAVATAEIEDSAITFAKLGNNAASGAKISNRGIIDIAKLGAEVIDADTGTLSSGSRWVEFRQAFGAPPFVAASFTNNGRTNAQSRDGDWVGVGSIAAGSFLALGSPGGFGFNWIAIGSR